MVPASTTSWTGLTTVVRDPASFRDPAGYVALVGGELVRVVRKSYAREWRLLNDSGLLAELQSSGWMVAHEAVSSEEARDPDALCVIRPERISFQSYPYEWCFGQLKEAALLTLDIQMAALGKGMCLKDASAFNVLFHKRRPVFIDSLSFEIYEEGSPWKAYRQFCEHFLAPLVLMADRDPRLGALSRLFLDGVPLDLASKLASARTRVRPGIGIHLHLHAKAQRGKENASALRTGRVTRTGLLGLVSSLRGTVEGIRPRSEKSRWSGYYADTNYSDAAMAAKQRLVSRYLSSVTPAPRQVWDLGANTGTFSEIAARTGALTIAWDADSVAVDRHWRQLGERGEENVLPLVQDFANPSPSIGWAGTERKSLGERATADLAMALALVHHLSIANNVPLPSLADWLAGLAPWLIVEFVPRSDSQVVRMLSTRGDDFADYTDEAFRSAFLRRFEIVSSDPIVDSERILFLMRRKDGV
jgi:hypothetical protein